VRHSGHDPGADVRAGERAAFRILRKLHRERDCAPTKIYSNVNKFFALFTAKSAMNLRLINEHEKSNELVRNETNSDDVSSFEFVVFVAIFFIPERKA